MQKKLLASACLFLAGISAAKTHAAVVLNETFDGYTNSNLVGQGGWTITGTTATNPIQVTGGTNKVASLVATGQDAFDALSQVIPHTTGNSIETDMTINVTTAGTGDYFAHLSDPVGTTSTFIQRLGLVATTGGYFLELEPTAGGGGAFTVGTTVLPLSTNENVDIVWNFLAGTTSDTFSVSVNGTPYPGLTSVNWGSTVAEPAQISAANFRQGTTGSSPVLTVDNYEVQGTPAVPEPATASLLALASVATFARRRRRTA